MQAQEPFIAPRKPCLVVHNHLYPLSATFSLPLYPPAAPCIHARGPLMDILYSRGAVSQTQKLSEGDICQIMYGPKAEIRILSEIRFSFSQFPRVRKDVFGEISEESNMFITTNT